MNKISKKTSVVIIVFFLALCFIAPAGHAKDGKMGYVDLRRAFYEYEKTKTMETELNTLTEDRQKKRTSMIETLTKMRDEAELLKDKAKAKKQEEIDNRLAELQEFDRETRQELLNRKNDMFREVIDDIQKVVTAIGEKEGYDYVLDSRNIMYANPDLELTEEVIKRLNK